MYSMIVSQWLNNVCFRMAFPREIRIREVGVREGFQTLTQVVPTEKKLKLISALNKTGVKDIEICSFVRADKVPQMADAEEIVAGYERTPGVNYTGLYLNPAGFERAEQSKRLDNQGWLYIAASETFLQKNNNCGIAEMLAKMPDWVASFKRFGKTPQALMISSAFGCHYEGKIGPDKVMSVIGPAMQLSEDLGSPLQEISLADTTGLGTPISVKTLVRKVKKNYPYVTISLHLHDTYGSGLANACAGLEEGIGIFDASVGGMGGCPFANGAAGNICTEDLAFMCESMGIATGLNLSAYVEAAKLAQEIVGVQLPGKLFRTALVRAR